jgi:hypothetical protein
MTTHPEHPRTRTVTCYALSASAQACVLPRVLGELARRSLVPESCHAAREGATLFVDLQIAGLDAPTAAHLGNVLRGIVDVESVLVSEKGLAPARREPACMRVA